MNTARGFFLRALFIDSVFMNPTFVLLSSTVASNSCTEMHNATGVLLADIIIDYINNYRLTFEIAMQLINCTNP